MWGCLQVAPAQVRATGIPAHSIAVSSLRPTGNNPNAPSVPHPKPVKGLEPLVWG